MPSRKKLTPVPSSPTGKGKPHPAIQPRHDPPFPCSTTFKKMIELFGNKPKDKDYRDAEI